MTHYGKFTYHNTYHNLVFWTPDPTHTLMAFTGVTNSHGPHLSQQHAGLQHAVWQQQQEVTRPKARFKPFLPEKSGVDWGAIMCKHILVCCFTCTPHCDLLWPLSPSLCPLVTYLQLVQEHVLFMPQPWTSKADPECLSLKIFVH